VGDDLEALEHAGGAPGAGGSQQRESADDAQQQ